MLSLYSTKGNGGLYICKQIIYNDMQTQEFEIMIGNNHHPRNRIAIDINEIPFPTAIYFFSNGEVLLNKRAFKCLGMRESEAFDLYTWRKINPYLDDMIKNIHQDMVIDQKMHVILFNGKHEIMNYSFSCFSNLSWGKMVIVHFSKVSEKYAVASLSALYNIRDEVSKLKPYLNRAGQKILQNLITKYFREENQQLTLDDLVYYERELRIIQKAYPSLSHREIILCGLLVNDLNSKDIATIMNRTIDAVFVTIHRINKKLNLLNKKQLVNTLKKLISQQEEDQNIPTAV